MTDTPTDTWPDPNAPGVPARDVGREIIERLLTIGWRCEWPHEKPVPDDCWPIDIINAEVAAREAAAKEAGMREAAGIAQRMKPSRVPPRLDAYAHHVAGEEFAASRIAAAILARVAESKPSVETRLKDLIGLLPEAEQIRFTGLVKAFLCPCLGNRTCRWPNCAKVGNGVGHHP